MNTLEILQAARELISVPERWTQGCLARNRAGKECSFRSNDSVRWCSIGALNKISTLNIVSHALVFLSKAVSVKTNKFSTWNDTHTHAEVLQAFDRAIELAKEGE